jgi:outer membrane lipoprotein carrier protein
MKKSQDWFKSGKVWSLDFKLQLFYADSPDIVSQQGKLVVAEGDKFKLELAGIKFYSDGESMWQHNVEQKQVLIKLVEDLSSSLHPSELLFKYLN